MLHKCYACNGQGQIWTEDARKWFSELIRNFDSERLFNKWKPLLDGKSIQNQVKISHRLETAAREINDYDMKPKNLGDFFGEIAKGNNPTPRY